MKIYVLNFSENIPENSVIINTTSRSDNWSRGLSPFVLHGGLTWNGIESFNVENAWQYSKVYPEYADINNEPTEKYFQWAKNGWQKIRADRYPMGKGVKPLYTLWDNKKLDYLDAKEQVYIFLYARSVIQSKEFLNLQKIYQLCKKEDRNLVLHDFDAYNHHNSKMSYIDVIKNTNKKFGHAFVLAMLLENKLDKNFKLKPIITNIVF